MTAADSGASKQPSYLPGARIGRVRWTICAMLFAATTINYMDRRFWGFSSPPSCRALPIMASA
jgi:MFS transporter, ACS family, hexuronate transporter